MAVKAFVETGGPAFPRPASFSSGMAPETKDSDSQDGMTLRDYFAGLAAHGAANSLCDAINPDYRSPGIAFDPATEWEKARRHAALHARCAYMFADEMLRARDGL